MIGKTTHPIFSHGILAFWGIILALCLLCFVILFPRLLNLRAMPSQDSGVFLYIGQGVLDGEVPYRDTWDHKPPLIFFINALGLWLGRGNAWGVWILEWLLLSSAAGLSFLLLNSIFGILPAFFSAWIWVSSIQFLIGPGNFTEEFALPLQFAALFLFYRTRIVNGRKQNFLFLLLGSIFVLTFFLKQNLIGIWIAIGIFLVFENRSRPKRQVLMVQVFISLLGGLITSSIILAYFAIHHALADLWDAAFVYNFAYSTVNVNFTRRLVSLQQGLIKVTPTGLLILGSLGWTVSVWRFIFRGKLALGNVLVVIAFIGLPLELALVMLAGKPHGHYFLTLLPLLALLTGFLFYTVLGSLSGEKRKIGVIIVACVGVFASYRPIVALVSEWNTALQFGTPPNAQLITYIETMTDENDYVLMWGAETSINFVTNRRSPTRYVYQYPLYRLGYQRAENVFEFLQDIQQKQPILIIDASLQPASYALPLDRLSAKDWPQLNGNHAALPEMQQVLAYIHHNYEVVDVIEGWPIYRLIDR